MSMTLITAMQTVGAFVLYTALVLLLPAIAFVKKLRVMSVGDRFLFCVVVGNFWIITASLMLCLLGIGNRFTLLLATYGLAGVMLYLRNKQSADRFFRKQGMSVGWFFRGELRGMLYMRRGLRRGLQLLGKQLRKVLAWMKPHAVELLLLSLCLLGNVWFFSYQSLYYWNIGTSDVIVHATWINAMLDGTLFVNGVYPYGYHAIIYYIASITGMDTLYLLRVMGTVQSLYIFMMFFLFARSLCKSKYAAMVSFILISLCSAFVDNAMMRYQWALPQEYAMLFLYPMAYYLFRYFRQYRARTRKEIKSEAAERKAKRKSVPFLPRAVSFFTRASTTRSSTLPLLLASICVSLTLSVHFYVTIAAFELFVAVVLVNFPAIFKPQCLRRLVLYMMLFVGVSVLPMGLALATGTKPEASLTWGMSIVENYEANSKEVLEEPYKSLIYDADLDDPEYSLKDKIFAVLRSASTYIEFAVTQGQWYYVVVGALLFAIFFSPVGMLIRFKSEYVQKWAAITIYTLMLISIVKYPMLGFPALMEGSRASIFLAYAFSLLVSLPFDLFYCLITVWKRASRACNALLCAFCFAFVGYTRTPQSVTQNAIGDLIAPSEEVQVATGMHKVVTPAKNLTIYYHFEYATTVMMIYDLIRNYEPYTWTMMSPVTETSLFHGYGRHADLTTFIQKLDKYTAGMKYEIPTEYVFILVEKKALNYWQRVDLPDGPYETTDVSEQLAISGFPGGHTKGSVFYSDFRPILMSKAYYWAQKMQELYPYEMTVYYEDEYCVWYRLHQNVNELFNLALDYGYNANLLKEEASAS